MNIGPCLRHGGKSHNTESCVSSTCVYRNVKGQNIHETVTLKLHKTLFLDITYR